jgi:hypothetical protein
VQTGESRESREETSPVDDVGHSTHDGETLLNTKQAAEFLGLKKNSLEQFRVRGRGPKYLKSQGLPGAKRGIATGVVRYRKKDLLAYEREREGEYLGGAEDELMSEEEQARLEQSKTRHPSRGPQPQDRW